MNSHTIKSYFQDQFGMPPELIIRAPGRINLIGEHTDYNGGFVLPAAIDKSIWMAATPRSDGRFAFFAADLGEKFDSENGFPVYQKDKTWANYLLGVISEAQKDGLKIGGLNLAFGGDVPLGAGLSSSAALESGIGFILNQVFKIGLSPMDIVRLAQRGENDFVGMKCGIMDMFASVMGRENQVVRLDCRTLNYEYFPFQNDDYSLLLLDSGVKHQLVDSEYNRRREECEAGVEILKKFDDKIEMLRDVTPAFLEQYQKHLPDIILKRCQFVVEEIARVEAACEALQKSDFKKVGKLMYDSHEGLNWLYEVCVPETNFLVEEARRLHVSGARQMGGGFGGCTINLIKTNELEPFIEQVSESYQRFFLKNLNVYRVHLSEGVEQVCH